MAQNTTKTIIANKQTASKPKVQPIVALGYILMIGGGSEDPKVFSEKIFDFQRLTLAPIVLIIGFIIEVFAIMVKPKE